MTKPVLYWHFTSKPHLYAALVRSVGEELSAVVRASSEDPALGEDPLERTITALVAAVLRLDARARILTPSERVHEDVDAVIVEQRGQVLAALAEAITRSKTVTPEQASAVALAVFATVIVAGSDPVWTARPPGRESGDLERWKSSLLYQLLLSFLATLEDR